MIDWTKPIRTHDGRPVHVIAAPYVENPGDEPVALVSILPTTGLGSDPTPLKRNMDGTPLEGQNRGSVIKLENFTNERTLQLREVFATFVQRNQPYWASSIRAGLADDYLTNTMLPMLERIFK